MRLSIQLVPGAKHQHFQKQTDLYGQEIRKIRVTAPAKEGKANAALIDFLADYLHTPKSTIRIVQGATSRHKLVEIANIS